MHDFRELEVRRGTDGRAVSSSAGRAAGALDDDNPDSPDDDSDAAGTLSADDASEEDEVPPGGAWARFWVDLGTCDEMALDVLINSLAGWSRDHLHITHIRIGGVNPDWTQGTGGGADAKADAAPGGRRGRADPMRGSLPGDAERGDEDDVDAELREFLESAVVEQRDAEEAQRRGGGGAMLSNPGFSTTHGRRSARTRAESRGRRTVEDDDIDFPL